jgi:hypothetical protein
MLKLCKSCSTEKHREEFYKLSAPKYKKHWDVRDSLCKPCRLEYGVKRRQNTKKQAVEYMGGSCKDCGLKTDKYCVYDFHHLDPTKKDFAFADTALILEKLKPELDKCVLLCSNCHRIRHYT